MIDDIFKYLRSKMAANEWTRIDELTDTMRQQGLTEKELEDVVNFLMKYFVEVDTSGQCVKLNSWTYNFFEVSKPRF